MRWLLVLACLVSPLASCGRTSEPPTNVASNGDSGSSGTAAAAPSGDGGGGRGALGSGGNSPAGEAAASGSGGRSGFLPPDEDAAAPDPTLCAGEESEIRVTGELSGFGDDLTFGVGCDDSPSAPYPRAASVAESRSGGEVVVFIVGCREGGAAIRARIVYRRSRLAGDAAALPFERATLEYGTGGVWSSLRMTELTERETPAESWPFMDSGSEDGVGNLYAGSLVAEGATGEGMQVRVTAEFSVCHVKNSVGSQL